MQRAQVLTLFVGLIMAPLVVAPSQAVAIAPAAGPPLLFGHDLIRPKQEVPDDPLAGLPSRVGSGRALLGPDHRGKVGKPSQGFPLSDDGGGHGKSGGGGSTRAACAVKVNAANDRDIGDLRATLAFVKHGPTSWPCPPRAAKTEVRLRISIDGAGKITAAEPVAGDSGIAGAMAKRLPGKAIGPRDQGATVGIVVLTFATGRP